MKTIPRKLPWLAAALLRIERGLAAGFCRYLTKPIPVTEFMQLLDGALEQAQTWRTDAAVKGMS